MAQSRNNEPGNRDKNRPERMDGPETPSSMDMNDSRTDEERLKQDTSYIELPDVADIPGQEKITNAGFPGAMGDTTISSDDEEGVVNGEDILDDDDAEIVMGTEADVTAEDLAILGPRDGVSDMGAEGLDDTDLDGEPLNEAATSEFSTGDDLDMPVADGSDPNADAMGQGDEENDYYSLGSDNNDETVEGTP